MVSLLLLAAYREGDSSVSLGVVQLAEYFTAWCHIFQVLQLHYEKVFVIGYSSLNKELLGKGAEHREYGVTHVIEIHN